VPAFDPFLLLDDFRSGNPAHYLKGFPWHPHRGIETITYVLKGDVEHGDSMGNKGIISTGDVQWMTAGSGIIHQEMPKGDAKGAMEGFQLWANLPAKNKMMEPRYRDVKSSAIPEVKVAGGATVRVICGTAGKTKGPVRDIVTDPEYLDVSVPAGSSFVHATRRGHTVIAYVFEGEGIFDSNSKTPAGNHSVILFDDGDHVEVVTKKSGVRFLLVSGRPLGEPVAWYGPIVMNTEEELRAAFEEYENGTFIKHGRQT
jgi:redox-sensitive bicupin YhaK (pirin superfamily)